MSLRMAAVANASSAPQPTSTIEAPKPRQQLPRNAAAKSWVIGDFDRNDSLTLCNECLAGLRRADITPTSYETVEKTSCATCRVREIEPEAFTKPFLKFLQENPTIFHTVDYFKAKASDLGYTELPARDNWSGKLEPGGKYFVSRNGSSLLAFTVGKAYKPGNGVAIVAGHIDALTAKLKPVSSKPNKAGYIQLGVAPYAGGLNETWWDRDLSIGGRVIVRNDAGKTSSKLVKIGWPSTCPSKAQSLLDANK